jgi:hypothetical protein
VRAALTTAVALGALALVLAPASSARDVTGAHYRALVRQAQDDPSALTSLRGVDSVDGMTVDVERALAGASGRELKLRLRALSGAGAAASGTGSARQDAARILDERRFKPESTPRPFRRLLEWLSAPVREAGEALDRAVEFLAGPLPGGESTFWVILALLVCTAAAVVATRIARRRGDVAVAVARGSERGPKLDPRRLEREAVEAERRGDLELALRLRFRAGLVRLGLARVIPLRDSLTTGDVKRKLQQPEFDRLANTFDEIVYGRRNPEQADVEDSRAGWPRVLKAAGA